MADTIVSDIDHIETHLTVESSGASATELLHQATGLSKQRIKFAMSQGAVWVTRGRNTQRLRPNWLCARATAGHRQAHQQDHLEHDTPRCSTGMQAPGQA